MTLHKDIIQDDHNTEQTFQLPTAAEARAEYEKILNSTSDCNKDLSNIVKVLDVGDARNLMTDAAAAISKLTRNKEEHGATRFFRRMGFGSVVDKVKDDVVITRFEGMSIAEVNESLLKTIQDKKDQVDQVFSLIINLRDSLMDGYQKMEIMADSIKGNMNNFSEEERYHMVSLELELRETMTYQKDNILNAQGGIKAAQEAAALFSKTLPKLRAQMNDSANIQAALNDVDDLTDMIKVVDTACQEMRNVSRTTMERQLMDILDRSVVSDTQLALIDENNQKQKELQMKLADKYAEVESRKAHALEKLQAATGDGSNLLTHGDPDQ